MELGLVGGRGHSYFGRNRRLIYFSMRIMGIQASGAVGLGRVLLVGKMNIEAFRITFAGK